MPTKRLKTYTVVMLLLVILLGLAVVVFQRYYRRHLWDPMTIAMINGKPLPTTALEEIMELGYHQSMAVSNYDGGSDIMSRILDRLIDEELVMQAAAKEGLKIDPAEVEANLEVYRRSFGCQNDPGRAVCQATPGSSGESLVKAVEKQLLLKTMGALVSRREGRPNSEEWRVFFRQWLAKYSFSSIYRVRVVLTQVGDEASKILRTRGKVTLEDLAERLREAGLEAKVAGPMSLNLMSPDTMKQFRSIGLGPELTRAMAKPGKMTGPVRLASSLAVFEVLEVIKPIGPKELAQAAKIEYERQVGEKAFNLWLDNLRSEATIEINPNLLASIDDENLSDMLKPKVPWKSLTPWDETLPGGPRPTGPDGLDGTLGPDGGGEVVTSPDAVDFSGPWPTFKSDNQPHMPLPQEEASGPTAGDPVTGLTTGNPAAGDQSDGRIPGGPSAIDQSDGPVSVATED